MKLLRLLARGPLFLNRKQIHAVSPGRSKRAVNLRVEKLERAGMVSLREPDDFFGDAMLGLCYLGGEAQKVLDPEGRDAKLAWRLRRAQTFSDRLLPHLQLGTWIHIKFLTAVEDYEDYELVSWISEYAPLWSVLNQHGLSVQPDGYAEYNKSGTRFHTFIEADRRSYRGESVRKKLEGYRQYAASGRSVEHFSARSFRVLWVTKSERGARELLRVMKSAPRDLFLVSTREEFFSRPLFDPHWRSTWSDTRLAIDEAPESLPEPPETPASRIQPDGSDCSIRV